MSAPDPAAGDPRDVLAALGALLACAIFLTFIFLQAQRPAPAASIPLAGTPEAAAPAVTTAGTATEDSTATLRATANLPAAGTVTATAVSTATIQAPTMPVTATVAITTTTAAAPLSSGGTVTGQGSVVPLVDLAPPLFSYRRSFSPDHAVEASRYYPYGTDGRGDYLLHHGLDIGNAMDTPVLAIADGEVVYAGDDIQRVWGPYGDFYGNVVVLRHPGSFEGQPVFSLYGHLNHVDVAAGQTVQAGDQIGRVGMAGIALGPHLHLELRVGDAGYEDTRNGELFLAPLPGRGTIVGRALAGPGQLAPNVRVSLFRIEPDGSAKYVGETRSYPGRHVNSTAELGENFLFADTLAGRYRLVADQPIGATANLTLTAGAALMVELLR